MRRRLVVLVLAGSVSLAAEAPPPGVALDGCVAKPLTVDAVALQAASPHFRLVKVSSPEGSYRGAYEVSGASLRQLLARAGVRKAVDDGFPRPLDTYLLVTSRTGERVVLSWGEVEMVGDDAAVLLADRLRSLLPHHHDEDTLEGWNRGLLGPAERRAVDVGSCASCHAGPRPAPIVTPQGTCLVPGRDRRGERFLGEVREIRVCQAGPLSGVKGKKGEATRVEEPVLVLPGGRTVKVDPALLQGLPPVTWQDVTFGAGRGYHGDHSWSGVGLSALLRKALGRDVDPRRLALLVTASDGYRSLYSGGEMAFSALGEGLLLADSEDGKPIAGGDGRYRLVPRGDFFVDRAVRSVAELRFFEVGQEGECGLPLSPGGNVEKSPGRKP